MALEDDALDFKAAAKPNPPAARVYRHRQCGSLTEIGGHNFLRLANPFAVVTETMCCRCQRAVAIRHVEWADTGENVMAYRRRLRAQTPLGRRLFFCVLGGAVGAFAGFVCGYIGGLLLIGAAAGRPWWRQESGLIAAPIVAFAGFLIGAQLLTAPLMRTLWGLDYRGEP